MACSRNKLETFELFHSKVVVKTATLKADDEIKVRRIFSFKTFIYVEHMIGNM